MKLMIINKDLGSKILPEMPYVHIMVTDTNSDWVDLPKNEHRIDALKLKFDDIDEDLPKYGLKAIRPYQAEKIIDFVLEYKDKVDLIVCQCDGGVCRSAGMAVGISRLLGLDDDWIFKTKVPNMKVVREISRVIYAFN